MRMKYKGRGQWSFMLLLHAAVVVMLVKADGESTLLQSKACFCPIYSYLPPTIWLLLKHTHKLNHDPRKDMVALQKMTAPLVKKPPPMTVETFVGMIPRLDPLNHFRKYRGGFNVTNMHYWSSLAYTGIWGYTVATACLIFGVWSIIWQYCNWRHGKEIANFSSSSDVIPSVPVFCVIQFGILLLAASGVILWENNKLGHELKGTAGTLVSTVDRVTLQVDGAINLIPLSNIGPIANQDVAKKFLSACNDLRSTFRNLTRKVKLHKAHVYKVFIIVKTAVSVVASFMVLVVIIGTVSMFRSWPALLLFVYSLAIFTLVASWMIAGVGFVLASLAVDGCQAMQAYDMNPHNSSIAQLLPCLTPQAAAEALSGAKKAIKTVIRRSNAAVDLLNHQEQRLVDRRVISHPTILPHICDPFGPEPEFFPVGCSPAEGSFARFAEDYGKYCCDSDDIDDCLTSSTPIPKFAFVDATQAMNATKDVYMILPTIFRIITCNFVKMTFEEILMHRCGPLKGSLVALWISFIVASVALMPLLLLCVVQGKNFFDDRVTYILKTKAKDFGLPLPPCIPIRREMNPEITMDTRSSSGDEKEAFVKLMHKL